GVRGGEAGGVWGGGGGRGVGGGVGRRGAAALRRRKGGDGARPRRLCPYRRAPAAPGRVDRSGTSDGLAGRLSRRSVAARSSAVICISACRPEAVARYTQVRWQGMPPNRSSEDARSEVEKPISKAQLPVPSRLVTR